MFSLNELNHPQRIAAQTIQGPLLILAGAGSGKTRTVTYRIAHMVKDLGIDPKSILAVSFTNKAASEMRERVTRLLGRGSTKGMTLSTFHALGVQILRQEISVLGYRQQFTIFDTSDQMAVIREALKQYKNEKSFDRKQILSKISFLKNKGVSAEEFSKTTYFDCEDAYDDATEFVYHFYQDKLRFFNAIDFDDILFLTVRLFRENEELQTKYSERFKYIMIDEFQDTNPLQLEMIRYLTKCHNNLCVVGDDDQSIYAFRGADISNILSFEKLYPGTQTVKLEQNYRSNSSIIELANAVIKENKKRKAKTMWSDKQVKHKPLLWVTGDTDHEAAIVIEELKKQKRKGQSYSHMAILYRSNTQVPPIEDELRLAGVPYCIFGGQKFYEKKEVKDLIAYLGLIQNPWDEISLRRVLNVPHRGIGHATLKKFVEYATEEKVSLFKAFQNKPDLAPQKETLIKHFLGLLSRYKIRFKEVGLSLAIKELIDEIDYHEYIDSCYKESPKQAERRKNDVIQFIESSKRFQRHFQNATLKDFLERVLLEDSQSKDDDKPETEEVTLMTLHASKGLEYDLVFLVGMEEETLPHKRSLQDHAGDLSEERRLCYVGMTRAKERLIMTYAKERKLYGKNVPRHRSRFIHPLGELYTEQDRTTFGHLSIEEAQEYKKNFFSNLADSL